MNEYQLDMTITNMCGNAIIRQSDNSTIESEFNLHDTMMNNRSFKGERGTHKWRVYKDFDMINKLSAVEGDYLIVIGVRNNLVIVDDPSHDKNTSVKIRTFLLDPLYFEVIDLIHLSSEST